MELEFIDQLYHEALSSGDWSDVLAKFARLTGGLGALVVPLQGGFDVEPIWTQSIHEEVLKYNVEGWWQRDTRVARAAELGMRSGVHCDTQFVPEDRIRRDPFYQEFLRPLGFGPMLCLLTTVPGGPLVSIGVQRELTRGQFETVDADRFARLSVHVQRALSAASTLAAAQLTANIQGVARGRGAHGYILLDHRGNVLHADPLASELFGSVFSIDCKKLSTPWPSKRKALDLAIEAALPGKGPPTEPVALTRDGLSLSLLVQALPIRPESGLTRLAIGTRAILLVHDLHHEASGKLQSHLVALGLTPGQARVAEEIGKGATVKEAARLLGLSEQTVQSVLKTVYDRLGLSKQSQLSSLTSKLRAVGINKAEVLAGGERLRYNER